MGGSVCHTIVLSSDKEEDSGSDDSPNVKYQGISARGIPYHTVFKKSCFLFPFYVPTPVLEFYL